jgi:hypothetical protein
MESFISIIELKPFFACLGFLVEWVLKLLLDNGSVSLLDLSVVMVSMSFINLEEHIIWWIGLLLDKVVGVGKLSC